MTKHNLETLNEKLRELSETARNFVDNQELVERIEKIRNEIETIVRKHPIASIAAGLFIGYLFGRILRRD